MILVVDFTGAYSGSQEDITINNLGLNRNKKLKDKCSGTGKHCGFDISTFEFNLTFQYQQVMNLCSLEATRENSCLKICTHSRN